MIYVYGDATSKGISTITRQQLVGDSRTEVQLADGHAIESDSNPRENYVLNAASDDVELSQLKLKILSLANAEAADKHFHNIDYTCELTQSLYPKRTLVQGELQLVEWYSDVGLTDLVLKVDIVYTRDECGTILRILLLQQRA